MSRPALEMCDVTKWYSAPLAAAGRVAALERVNLSVQAGELVGIIGPAGAGKSTLLRCAAALLAPSEGTIALADAAGGAPSVSWLSSRREHPPCITPRELLALAPALRRLSLSEREERVDCALHTFALQSRADRPIVHLGAHSELRVALALALIGRPSLLVIDQDASAEPVLPAGTRALLLSQRDDGLAVLAAARDRRALPAPPDRVLLLVSGRVRAELSAKKPGTSAQRRNRSAARASDSSWSARA